MEPVRTARTLWSLLAAIAVGASLPANGRAQTAPLTVPGGALRIGLGAGLDSWNDVLPGPGQAVQLEAAQATRLSGSLGLAIGLSSRFTLFGSFPFERVRVQAEPADPGVDIPGDRAMGPGDAVAGLAWRVAGAPADAADDGARLETAVLGRFPTGRVLRQAQYYTLTAGQGADLELGGRIHLPAGGVGLRLDGSWVMPLGETHTGADLDPWFRVSASPWLKIAREVALEGSVEQILRSDEDGGAATAVGGGLAYYSPGGRPREDGSRPLPIGAFWRMSKVISAGEGAPEPFSVTAGIQLYYGLFR